MNNSFYSNEELKNLGLFSYGKNVLISRKASFYQPEFITVGNNVRIDDFCIISGKNIIGSFVHVAAMSCLYGADVGIEIGNYSNISSRCAIYSISDDYSGNSMTNPMVPIEFKKIVKGKIIIKDHVIIGSGCTILPGVTIGTGASIGCMSLIKNDLLEWNIYAGIPCRKIKERKKQPLLLMKKMKEMFGED